MQRFKGVGDVAQEDQTEDDVLVFGGVDVLAELVSGREELLFERFLVVFWHLIRSWVK